MYSLGKSLSDSWCGYVIYFHSHTSLLKVALGLPQT